MKKPRLEDHPTLGIVVGVPKKDGDDGGGDGGGDGYAPSEHELKAFDELAEALGVEPKDREAGAKALCAFLDLHEGAHEEPDEDDEDDGEDKPE